MKLFVIKIFVLVGLFSVFTGCDTALVSEVKQTKYGKGITIAELFEDSDFCDSVDWSEVEYEKGQKLVLMECQLPEEGIAYKGFDTLLYHFEKTKNDVDVYNSFYENDKEELIERSAWEANLLLRASMEYILKNR
ncbi:hypothetical protein [Sulfurimonas microaerophilic]|uniref:hypothetical protein n=1 Tax=Sulfurimonas microaerophilic TaxID=3058392 RepID=UPI002714BEB9|nr:hypothetical protein [Sulfurimonas sp. hsl 1-7]